MGKTVKSAKKKQPTTRLIRFVLYFGKNTEEHYGYVIARNKTEAMSEARKRAVRFNHRYVAPDNVEFEVVSRKERKSRETAQAAFFSRIEAEVPA